MANLFRSQFTVFPQVLRVSAEEKKIVIHARQEHAQKLLDAVDNYHFITTSQPRDVEDLQWLYTLPPDRMERQENGDLQVYAVLPKEGEYVLFFTSEKDGVRSEVMSFAVYALNEDLFALRPWKGDLHIHSSDSDGKETPAFVMATCRRDGFDFMAVTDHYQYAPSLAAQAAADECSCDILVVPGEEVHLPGNTVHVINFGGNWSINDLARQDEARYRKEALECVKDLPAELDMVNRFEVGASEWTFERIRESGGICMFCHPYWHVQYRNHIDEEVIDILLERNKFDVLEVFGGYVRKDAEANMLALARWQEERAKGKVIPVAGVSDAHGCDNSVSNWYYTIVYADKLDFKSLAEAIRSNRSVAVHAIPGEYPYFAGDFRLTKLSYFLYREFYPRHDEICHLEGTIMRSYYSEGAIDAPKVIKSLAGSAAEFMENFWEK